MNQEFIKLVIPHPGVKNQKFFQHYYLINLTELVALNLNFYLWYYVAVFPEAWLQESVASKEKPLQLTRG